MPADGLPHDDTPENRPGKGNPTHLDSFVDACGYEAIAGELASRGGRTPSSGNRLRRTPLTQTTNSSRLPCRKLFGFDL